VPGGQADTVTLLCYTANIVTRYSLPKVVICYRNTSLPNIDCVTC